MSQKMWMNKASSFPRAEEFDRSYYLKMRSGQRLEIMQLLREQYPKMRRGRANESGKRLRRVLAIIKQK